MSYQTVLQKFSIVQNEIDHSDHDSLSYEDHEASMEELVDCFEAFKLEMPEDIKNPILPKGIITDAFGGDCDKTSKEYESLEDTYIQLCEQIVNIATEISAYYENEMLQEEKYYDSMRGSI